MAEICHDNEFERIYPEQKTEHLATNMVKRAMFGGDSYLDGIYRLPVAEGQYTYCDVKELI